MSIKRFCMLALAACSMADSADAIDDNAVSVALRTLLLPVPGATNSAFGKEMIPATPEGVAQVLGTNNISTFLMSLDLSSPPVTGDKYEWRWIPPDAAVFAIYWEKHRTAIAPEDVISVNWHETGKERIQGKFTVSTGWGLDATFLFSGREMNGALRVTKIVVKNKTSDRIEDGITVVELPGGAP